MTPDPTPPRSAPTIPVTPVTGLLSDLISTTAGDAYSASVANPESRAFKVARLSLLVRAAGRIRGGGFWATASEPPWPEKAEYIDPAPIAMPATRVQRAG